MTRLIVSYRKDLWEMLNNARIFVDFVGGGGEQHDQYTPRISTPTTKGMGGQDNEIANNIYGFLGANPADIILLHTGTNALDIRPDDKVAKDIRAEYTTIDGSFESAD